MSGILQVAWPSFLTWIMEPLLKSCSDGLYSLQFAELRTPRRSPAPIPPDLHSYGWVGPLDHRRIGHRRGCGCGRVAGYCRAANAGVGVGVPLGNDGWRNGR